jgi:hypothetical protein
VDGMYSLQWNVSLFQPLKIHFFVISPCIMYWLTYRMHFVCPPFLNWSGAMFDSSRVFTFCSASTVPVPLLQRHVSLSCKGNGTARNLQNFQFYSLLSLIFSRSINYTAYAPRFVYFLIKSSVYLYVGNAVA